MKNKSVIQKTLIRRSSSGCGAAGNLRCHTPRCRWPGGGVVLGKGEDSGEGRIGEFDAQIVHGSSFAGSSQDRQGRWSRQSPGATTTPASADA